MMIITAIVFHMLLIYICFYSSLQQDIQNKYSATEIEKCFQIYKKQHGDLQIPREYCIPEEEEEDLEYCYPKHLVGAPLGEMLYALKCRKLYFNSYDVMFRWKKLGISFSSKRKHFV